MKTGYFDGRTDEYLATIDTPWFRLRHHLILERLRRLLGPNRGRWLDVGCGDGEFAAALASDGWAVTAIDGEAGLVSHAGGVAVRCGVAGRVTLVHDQMGPAELAALGQGQWDGVSLHNVLEYMDDRMPAIGAAATLLRPGGWLSVVFGNAMAQPILAAVRAGDAAVACTELDDGRLSVGVEGARTRVGAILEGDVRAAMAAGGLDMTVTFGVRVLSDLLFDRNQYDARPTPGIVDVELRLGELAEYLGLARYIHVVGQMALMRASGLAIRQTRAKPLAGEHCMALDRESC